MIKLILYRRHELPRVLFIEAWEVDRWIEMAQKHRFAIELEVVES